MDVENVLPASCEQFDVFFFGMNCNCLANTIRAAVHMHVILEYSLYSYVYVILVQVLFVCLFVC